MSVAGLWTAAEELRAAFKIFDADSNGSISPEELLAILTRPETGNTLSLEDATRIVSQFDADKDGHLSLDEVRANNVISRACEAFDTVLAR